MTCRLPSLLRIDAPPLDDNENEACHLAMSGASLVFLSVSHDALAPVTIHGSQRIARHGPQTDQLTGISGPAFPRRSGPCSGWTDNTSASCPSP